MTRFRYGPVELHLVGFSGERPDPGVIQALTELLEGGLLRLLDLVIISRNTDGVVTVTEIEDAGDEYDLGGIELEEMGIAGEEDIAEFAELVPAGASAALVALELSYLRILAQRLDATGGVVLRSDRIPAPVVNAVMNAAEAAEGA